MEKTIAYLSQIEECSERIESKIEELRILNSIATKVTSCIGQTPVNGSRPGDRIGSAVEKIVPQEEELEREAEKYKQLRQEIKGVIDQVPNAKQRKILRKCYLGEYDPRQKKTVFQSIKEISNESGKSERQTRRLHNDGVRSVKKIMNF